MERRRQHTSVIDRVIFLRETSPSLKTGFDISRPPQKNFSAPSVLQIEAVCIMFQYN